MKRKLSAIWSIIKCKNYLLTTFKNGSLLHDHTMTQNDVVKYSKTIIKYYTEIEPSEDFLLKAKDILGI